MKQLARSLTWRLCLFSILWITLALILTAVILRGLYREHIEVHFDAHVFSHVEELVAALDRSGGDRVSLLRRPTDPRFLTPDSGWYWEVVQDGEVIEKSLSLGDGQLDLSGVESHEQLGAQTAFGPGEQQLRAHMMTINYPDTGSSVLVVATSPEMQISDDVGDYFKQIMVSFLVLGIGLSLAVVFQVIMSLRPLQSIRQAIGRVQSGQQQRLPDQFPIEVQPLADELNNLLDHDERLVKRARTLLGDLAHAVKNPLTVIRNEARSMPNEQGQLILDQTHIMASNIDHYLSLARSHGTKPLGLRIRVQPIVDDLKYVVEHVYRERGVEITMGDLSECWFRGESQDLEEMVGNLMDNACKWARHKVTVAGGMVDDRLTLVIEDDGPGIPADKRKQVLKRGSRLDDSTPGHGQGLGIVRDICALYDGQLSLSDAKIGGLQARLDLPG